MPICEMALFKAAYALVLKLAPVSRGSTANFMVFITVSTRPGSCRPAAFRPVFGSVFAFRPLNEEYCIPDTVHPTTPLCTSGEISFPQSGKGATFLLQCSKTRANQPTELASSATELASSVGRPSPLFGRTPTPRER